MKMSGAHLTFDNNSALPVDFHQFTEKILHHCHFLNTPLAQFHNANVVLTPVPAARAQNTRCSHSASPLLSSPRAPRIPHGKRSANSFAGGSAKPSCPRGNPRAAKAAPPGAKSIAGPQLTAKGSVTDSGCRAERSQSFRYFGKEGLDAE